MAQVSSIEFSLVEKDVLFGIKQGNAVLKDLNAQMKVEDVEKLMSDTAEGVAYQQASCLLPWPPTLCGSRGTNSAGLTSDVSDCRRSTTCSPAECQPRTRRTFSQNWPRSRPSRSVDLEPAAPPVAAELTSIDLSPPAAPQHARCPARQPARGCARAGQAGRGGTRGSARAAGHRSLVIYRGGCGDRHGEGIQWVLYDITMRVLPSIGSVKYGSEVRDEERGEGWRGLHGPRD